jgi:hypothetical protein
MPERLTQEAFTQHLHTQFRVRLGEEGAMLLELDEVKPFPTLSHSSSDLERFSLYFYGPGDVYLPQSIYRLEHEQMGELDIFLVPIARNERGHRYEAVFSYFKESEK